MHPFERLLLERFRDAMADWKVAQQPEIYAFSMLCGTGWAMNREGEEVAVESVSLSFNTESQVLRQVEEGIDESEARWNFAFWLQNPMGQVPRLINPQYGSEPDLGEMALVSQWKEDTESGEIFKACVPVAQELHRSIAFGRAAPFIIHSLTYDSAGTQATVAANPPELLGEFLREWI